MAQMPMSSRRSNRNGVKPIWIGLHTDESLDKPGWNDAAELRDATWWEGSSHAIADNEGMVDETNGGVDPAYAAWTLRDGNARSVNIEQIGQAKQTRQQWLDNYMPMLRRTAAWMARMSARFDIPLRMLTIDECRRGMAGVIEHNTYTQAYNDGTHWDCGWRNGIGYPIDVVIGMAQDIADGSPPTQEDDDMFSDADRAALTFVRDRLNGVTPSTGYIRGADGITREVKLGSAGSSPVKLLDTMDGNYIMTAIRETQGTLDALLAKPPAELTDEDVAAIVAAIPDSIAVQVADELNRRLDA